MIQFLIICDLTINCHMVLTVFYQLMRGRCEVHNWF